MIKGRLVDGYESIQDWWASFNHSDSYEKNCNTYMVEYCEHVDKDPDQLLAERKAKTAKATNVEKLQ